MIFVMQLQKIKGEGMITMAEKYQKNGDLYMEVIPTQKEVVNN